MIKVRKAGPASLEALIGVVEYKLVIETQTETFRGVTMLEKERFAYAGENVNSGDYLSVVVFGITDVKINSDENITAGQKLTSSALAGATRAMTANDGWSSGILGKSLEHSNGRGYIKAFVNCR